MRLNFDCQTCGACCAHFRVSFYNGECDFAPNGQVPSDLVETINPFLVCMKGTNSKPARCIALEGTIGVNVACQIYPMRSSSCRNFIAGSEACLRARAAHGLTDEPDQRIA